MSSTSTFREPNGDHEIIGTRRDTIDALDMVTGRSKYGLDTQVEGMRYAVIARSPILNGRVKSFDDSAAREVDGVLEGDALALGGIRLSKRAKVKGDLRASTLAIEVGASFCGELRIGPDEVPELGNIPDEDQD